MPLYAIEHLRDMGKGEMKAQLFRCSDGNNYVIKFMSNRLGPRALFNELISFRLGKLLNLPMAEGRIVYFSKKMLRDESIMKKFGIAEGPHFGSLFIDNASPFNSNKLSICTNINIAADMMVFDHWISNRDRRKSTGNLLIVGNPHPKLILIDHADAFKDSNWTIERLLFMTKNIEYIWGTTYEALVPYIDNQDPFQKALLTLDSITPDQIAYAVGRDIPNQWSVTKDELKVLLYHLIMRKNNMNKIMNQMKIHFPIWSSY